MPQFCHSVFFARRQQPSLRKIPVAGLLGLGRSHRGSHDAALTAWVERVWGERGPTRVLALCATMAPYALMRPDLPARRALTRSEIGGELWPMDGDRRRAIWRWLQARELRALMLLDQHRLASGTPVS